MKILIIDDDKSSLLLYSAFFRKEHQVYIGDDSRIAMMMFKEIQPDVVLLNSCMPHISGFEIAKEIRAIGNCKIVMMSASILEKETYNEYCDNFFPKPSPLGLIKEMVLSYRLQKNR